MIFVHKIKNKKENLKKSSFLKHPCVCVSVGVMLSVCACLYMSVFLSVCVMVV